MKACEEYFDLLLRSVDGETDQREETELQAHLARCPGCRALYDSQKAVAEGIRETWELPPRGITQGVMGEIRREKQRFTPRRWLKNAKFTMIAAVAAVLVLVWGRVSPGTMSNTTPAGAAAQAEAEMPQVAAEFQAPADEDVPAAQENGQAEEYADQETVESRKAAGTRESERADGGLSREKLLEAGCQGQVYQIGDWSPEDVLARFSQVETKTLGDGTAVYGVPQEEVQALLEEGALPVEESLLVGAQGDTVWLVLIKD